MHIVLEHYDDMLEHYGNDNGVRFARKHIGWYSAGLPGSAEYRNQANREHDPRKVKDHIKKFYSDIIEQEQKVA